jgi:dTDP-4-amino-4,6-dideoxygalactose transaminase
MYVSTWPGLAPSCLTYVQNKKALPFPLQSPIQTRFFAARYGIYHLIRKIIAQEQGAVLVPAYHHGNEVRAIRAAGASIRFYPIGRDLQPDLGQLERLCRGGARVLYVIHYLGWPQPIEDLRVLCRRHGLILIEDCALSLLSESRGRPLGSVGDYSVFCLYKTVPVPNGGLLVQNRNVFLDLARMPLRRCGPASVLSRSAELLLERMRSSSNGIGRVLSEIKGAAGTLTRRFGASRIPIGNTGFDWAHANVGASAISNVLLGWLDYEEIRRRRRSNYAFLAERLKHKATLIFPRLDEGICPLFFPVLAPDKHAAAERLWRRGIGAVEFWNEGDTEAGPDAFPESHFLRKHLLELPIHQDISPRQIEYIAREAEQLELI